MVSASTTLLVRWQNAALSVSRVRVGFETFRNIFALKNGGERVALRCPQADAENASARSATGIRKDSAPCRCKVGQGVVQWKANCHVRGLTRTTPACPGAQVYRARYLGETCAVKVFNMEERAKNEVIARTSHPHAHLWWLPEAAVQCGGGVGTRLSQGLTIR